MGFPSFFAIAEIGSIPIRRTVDGSVDVKHPRMSP